MTTSASGSAASATSVWSCPEYGHTYTSRREIKAGRNDYKDVDPAWLKRNLDEPQYTWEYWDGVTEHHPGKWVSGDETSLREAKRVARTKVESGAARHGCEVTLRGFTYGTSGTNFGLHTLWTYGSYSTQK